MSVNVEERITPAQFVEHFAQATGNADAGIRVSPLVIGSWNREFIETLVEETHAEPVAGWPFEPSYTAQTEAGPVTFIRLPVGAPAAVSTVECLIACGAQRIIGLGMAGSLRPALRIGDILLPDRCLIEEGTSRHYVGEQRESTANPTLAEALQSVLQAEGIPYQTGKIWTTDAIFRELKSKIEAYAEQGVVGVEMETSALYTIGGFRNVDICNLLVITDELWDEWNPNLVNSARVRAAFEKIHRAFKNGGIRRLLAGLKGA